MSDDVSNVNVASPLSEPPLKPSPAITFVISPEPPPEPNPDAAADADTPVVKCADEVSSVSVASFSSRTTT